MECDHQALKPLFKKNLKGAIYERWLAILQSFNFEIRYKKAEEMIVPDALSRAHTRILHHEIILFDYCFLKAGN